MDELLEYILKKLASRPEKIEIKKESNEGFITYTIKSDEEDKGRVIGREGRNIKAIRDLINVIARKENVRVMLKVE